MSESILKTVKIGLGIVDDDYEDFDPALITHINTVFYILYQMGVGPSTPFEIKGSDETWNDFSPNVSKYNGIKQYVTQKVRISFDPPQSGSAMEALKSSIDELEARLSWTFNYKEV